MRMYLEAMPSFLTLRIPSSSPPFIPDMDMRPVEVFLLTRHYFLLSPGCSSSSCSSPTAHGDLNNKNVCQTPGLLVAGVGLNSKPRGDSSGG